MPEGYERMGHRQGGWNLTRQYSSGPEAGHRTVMFTAEGTVFCKRQDAVPLLSLSTYCL